MDNAYSHGFDYDAYRASYRGTEVEDYPFELFSDPDLNDNRSIPHGRLKRGILVLSVVGLVLALGWYALRFIPLFSIERVTFDVTGGFTTVPQKAGELANGTIGNSLRSGTPANFEHALEALPVVQEVRVRRRFFSTLEVQMQIVSPSVFVAIVDADDVVDSIHLVKDGKLQHIDFQDFNMYGNNVFVVEVSPLYGKHLLAYGMDEGMENVVALTTDMGLDEDGRYRIVGRITYQESLGESFGDMVLDLPAYASRLYIREPVTESRLHDALRLIKLEHELDTPRNIALIGQVRYDLYAQSLVSRQ